MSQKQAVIISGFPGVGKTEFVKNYSNTIKCLDSDSSQFSWVKDKEGKNTKERNPEFPSNYINHIKNQLSNVDIIFVSSHEVVRKALEEANLNYILAYPTLSAKEEYLNRYRNRGNDEAFIQFISTNWEVFINDLKKEIFPLKQELMENEYLSSAEVWESIYEKNNFRKEE